MSERILKKKNLLTRTTHELLASLKGKVKVKAKLEKREDVDTNLNVRTLKALNG